MFRDMIIFVLFVVAATSPAVAVDTLQVTSPDPVSGATQDSDGAVSAAAGAVVSMPRPTPRRPGKPPGHAKPAGSGRKKGVPNKATAEIKAVAQKHGRKAINRLVKLLKSENEGTQIKAAIELLDRGYGRPITPTELSGPDGAPLTPTEPLSTWELSRKLAAVLLLAVPANNAGDDAEHLVTVVGAPAAAEPGAAGPAEPRHRDRA